MAIKFPSALDVIKKEALADVDVVANIAPQYSMVANNHVDAVVANSRHGKYADADKRREYMRKYMAARRLAKRDSDATGD